MADPFLTALLNGDLIGFVVSCYTSQMGMAFYASVLLIVFGMVYNQTRSLTLCAVLWLLLGGSWLYVEGIGEISPIAIMLFALGLTGIIYKLYAELKR